MKLSRLKELLKGYDDSMEVDVIDGASDYCEMEDDDISVRDYGEWAGGPYIYPTKRLVIGRR